MTQAELLDEAPGEAPRSRRALLGLGVALAAGAAGVLEAAPAQAVAAHHGRQYASPSAAAAAVKSARSALFPHDPQAHLLRRATFGPRPSDVQGLQHLGIDHWIDRQLTPWKIHDPAADAAAKLYPLAGLSAPAVIRRVQQYHQDAQYHTAQAVLARQVFSNRQIFEIVCDVFANRLHVPLPSEQWSTSPSFIRDVIRAHAFGRFEDMLVASTKHPAMLNFLSNDQSRRANVNENLGRELLELHTVGVAAGYSEHDVRASAQILSGRTWDPTTGEYYFMPPYHWTGHVRVLGFESANAHDSQGEAVGDAYVRYLARHSATARSVSHALAVRFVSDTPSADLVDRLARVYLSNHTSIAAVVKAIFCSSDFWASVGTRMRRPLEDAVGTLRVLDVRSASGMVTPLGWLFWNLNSSGQTPFGWGPPNGYPDVAAAWLSAGGMLQRWNLHRAFVNGWWPHLNYTKPSALVPRIPGMTVKGWTQAVARRLVGVQPSAKHVQAIVSGAGLRHTDPAPTNDWQCGKIAALVLDSPYFQLR